MGPTVININEAERLSPPKKQLQWVILAESSQRHTSGILSHTSMHQNDTGHETMQMIYERFYSYIKNYERAEGAAFMTNVYGPSKKGSHPAEIAA